MFWISHQSNLGRGLTTREDMGQLTVQQRFRRRIAGAMEMSLPLPGCVLSSDFELDHPYFALENGAYGIEFGMRKCAEGQTPEELRDAPFADLVVRRGKLRRHFTVRWTEDDGPEFSMVCHSNHSPFEFDLPNEENIEPRTGQFGHGISAELTPSFVRVSIPQLGRRSPLVWTMPIPNRKFDVHRSDIRCPHITAEFGRLKLHGHYTAEWPESGPLSLMMFVEKGKRVDQSLYLNRDDEGFVTLSPTSPERKRTMLKDLESADSSEE